MRIDEFQTSSLRICGNLYLKAWARYKRGDIPERGEVDYITRRVKAAYPEAELLEMRRRPVPKYEGSPYTEVWWQFEWRVCRESGVAE